MAARYWVGTSTSWNTAGNWASTSGGSGGAGVPTSADDVTFDANGTGNCTCDVAIDIASLTVESGYSGTLDLADSSYSHAISGNVTLDGSGRFDVGTSTVTIGGSFDYKDQATFDRGVSEIIMTGTGVSITGSNGNWLRKLTITNSVNVSSNTDTWVRCQNTLTVQNNATLSFDENVWCAGHSIGSSATISGTGTAYIYFYDNLTLSSGTNLSCYELRLRSSLVLDVSNPSNFTPTIVTATRQTWLSGTQKTVNGDWTWNASEGSSAIRIYPNTVFTGSVAFAPSGSGTITYDGNVLNPDLTFRGDFIINSSNAAVTWNKGTGTLIFDGATNQSLDFDGEIVEDIEIDKISGTATLTGAVTPDSILISRGILDINNQVVDVTDDVTMDAGTTMTDSLTGILSIGGNLSINGTVGSGCTWTNADIDQLTGIGTASYTTVSNSTNSSGTAIDATNNCIDSGGNTGWNFGAAPAPTIFLGSAPITGLKLGSSDVLEVYLGSQKIWPA